MAAHVRDATITERPETGWAKARRLRKSAIRTCVQATAIVEGPPKRGQEPNIVRGED
ncbi:hypothetical protein [Streptomyces sp. NPDC050145]|uniref:hypothetical protein n=1 Tax=Streptomyces sp. NPDC050145 TaxID=3365602 RepID=UPI0037AFEDD6